MSPLSSIDDGQPLFDYALYQFQRGLILSIHHLTPGFADSLNATSWMINASLRYTRVDKLPTCAITIYRTVSLPLHAIERIELANDSQLPPGDRR